MAAVVQRRTDRGQAVALLLVVVALVALAAVAVVGFADEVVQRDRAQIAADATALAFVAGGSAAAAKVADANGATVIAISIDSLVTGPATGAITVTVTVRVGARRATARATNAP